MNGLDPVSPGYPASSQAILESSFIQYPGRSKHITRPNNRAVQTTESKAGDCRTPRERDNAVAGSAKLRSDPRVLLAAGFKFRFHFADLWLPPRLGARRTLLLSGPNISDSAGGRKPLAIIGQWPQPQM